MMMDENVVNVLFFFYYSCMFLFLLSMSEVDSFFSPKTSSEAQLVVRELHPVMGDEGVLVTELGC